MTFTHALSTNNYGPAKFVVSSSAANGTHTTIASALAVATSGDTIFIRAGSYTENITLVAGVNLTAFGSDDSLNATGNVIIIGTCTLTTAGSVTISGIQLQTNSAAILAVTGSAASVVNLENCYLNMTNNTGITFSSSSASAAINMYRCRGNLGTTGIAVFSHSSPGNLLSNYSWFDNSGASSTASTVSAGFFTSFYSFYANPLTTSSTAALSFDHSTINTTAQNAIALTNGGSGSCTASFSFLLSGSASTISTSSTLTIATCTVQSSNTNAITGAGTAILYSVNYTGSSHQSNVTTQTGGAVNGLTQGTAPSVGLIGENIKGVNTSGTALSNTTPANISSVSLTAGIWDVSGSMLFIGTGSQSLAAVSINTTSATLGTNGDNTFYNAFVLASGSQSVSVPSWRVTISATTTVYLVGQANFSTGGVNGFGRISATRVG